MSIIDISFTEIAIVLFWSALAIQILYMLFIFSKSFFIKTKDEVSGFKDPVSVIICARNEFENLTLNLELFLNQNYHTFEIVVVNDRSWDGTANLLEKLADEYSNLKIVTVPESEMNPFTGKKFAKTLGVKGAKYEHLLFTDADCKPASENWIYEMTKQFDESDVLIGVSPLKGEKGLWAFISRIDSLLIAYTYISYTLSKMPYMAVGRNMAYTKDSFFSVKGFKSHYYLPSGDDDLFIRDVRKKTKISVVTHQDALTFSEPETKLRKWIRQKKRHFLTAPKYSFFNKLMLLTFSFSYLFLLGSFVYLNLNNSFNYIVLIGFTVRMLMFMVFAIKPFKLMDASKMVFILPFIELIVFLVNGLIYFSNLIVKPNKW